MTALAEQESQGGFHHRQLDDQKAAIWLTNIIRPLWAQLSHSPFFVQTRNVNRLAATQREISASTANYGYPFLHTAQADGRLFFQETDVVDESLRMLRCTAKNGKNHRSGSE